MNGQMPETWQTKIKTAAQECLDNSVSQARQELVSYGATYESLLGDIDTLAQNIMEKYKDSPYYESIRSVALQMQAFSSETKEIDGLAMLTKRALKILSKYCDSNDLIL